MVIIEGLLPHLHDDESVKRDFPAATSMQEKYGEEDIPPGRKLSVRAVGSAVCLSRTGENSKVVVGVSNHAARAGGVVDFPCRSVGRGGR